MFDLIWLEFRCRACHNKSSSCHAIYLTQRLVITDRSHSEPDRQWTRVGIKEAACAISEGKQCPTACFLLLIVGGIMSLKTEITLQQS